LLPTLHPRARRENRYVYVVRSRRAGGISIGVNLDAQKTCNFDCVYCEVIDRREVAKRAGRPPITVADVAAELEAEFAGVERCSLTTSPRAGASPSGSSWMRGQRPSIAPFAGRRSPSR